MVDLLTSTLKTKENFERILMKGKNFGKSIDQMKASAWEGGVRGTAAIWSPLIQKPKRVFSELMYIADWLPTLLSAADLRSVVPLGPIDGVDMWPSISGEISTSPRNEVLVNIDPIFNYSAIRRGDFKYVLGTVNNGEEWYGETGRAENAPTEGKNPTYDPDTVMMSKTGTAISGLLTSKQMSEIRTVRNDGYERVKEEELTTPKLLTADELLKLRSTATIHCNIPESERIACNPRKSPCLFNLKEDPCEQRNIADQRPMILATLEEALLKYRVTAIKPSNVPNDPRSNPVLYNNTWVNWQDSDPFEFLNDGVNKNRIDDPMARLPGAVIAIIAVLLGLAVLAIFTLIGLRCSKRYAALKKKQQQTRHFDEVQQPTETMAVLDQTIHDDNHTACKVLESFVNETKEMPSLKNLERSIE